MSDILKALKFIQGGVCKKENLPYQSHVLIESGKIRSFNGNVALCSPIQIDINCQPKAHPFIKVISECKDIPQISLAKNGKLDIKSGKLRVKIDCLSETMPYIVPSGTMYECDGELLLKAIKKLISFVTRDNKRQWARGMLFSQGSIFATCNVVLVQYWTNSIFAKDINIPLHCLEEIVRINEAPKRVQISDTSVTFHYEDGRWLNSSLISDKWPDVVEMLNAESNPKPVHPELWDALKAVKSFAIANRVDFHTGKITTGEVDSEYELDGFDSIGSWGASFLLSLEDLITVIDFSKYPKPAMFYGDNLRGVIIGHHVK